MQDETSPKEFASMAQNEDSLFREVDEELRREQLKRLWDNYGTYILGAVAAIVLGVGGVKWWQASREGAAEAAGSRFEQAIAQATGGKSDEAVKALQSIAKGDAPGYAALAQLAIAAEALKAGNDAQALTAYETVGSANGLDPLIRNYAMLKIAALKVDSADFTEIQNRLKDLMVEGSPWRFAARELVGVSALNAGKLDEARKALEPLVTDAVAPQGVRERAGALMSMVVETELARAAAAAAEQTPAPAAATEPAKTAPPKADPAGAGGGKKK